MPRKKIDGVTKADLFRIDPRIINVDPDWNEREDFRGHEELTQSIIANGVLNPVRVIRDKDDVLWLRNGERRLRATMEAIGRGHNIVSIPALMEKPTISITAAKYNSYIDNDGNKFTAMEEAFLFNKLIVYGETKNDISQKTGKSITYVSNSLLLVDGNNDLKEGVKKGTIKKTVAQKIIKKAAGDKEEEKQLTEEVIKNPKNVRAKITNPSKKTATIKMDIADFERLSAFLLHHEAKILEVGKDGVWGVDDFGNLEGVFKAVLKREPKE